MPSAPRTNAIGRSVGDEREAGVVEDVVRVEEHDAREARRRACSRRASQRARCSSGVIAIDVITDREPSALDEGGSSDREQNYIQRMSMRNFLTALAVTAVFLGILVVAGTAQNQGCLPWKEPIHRWERVLRGRSRPHRVQVSSWRSGAGVEPTEPWVTRPHEF